MYLISETVFPPNDKSFSHTKNYYNNWHKLEQTERNPGVGA